jgi:hypothetical protein
MTSLAHPAALRFDEVGRRNASAVARPLWEQLAVAVERHVFRPNGPIRAWIAFGWARTRWRTPRVPQVMPWQLETMGRHEPRQRMAIGVHRPIEILDGGGPN